MTISRRFKLVLVSGTHGCDALVEAGAVRVVGAFLAVLLPRAAGGRRCGGGSNEGDGEGHGDEEGRFEKLHFGRVVECG